MLSIKIEVIFQDCNTPTPYKLAEDVWAVPWWEL
jgi:hypothetical protein